MSNGNEGTPYTVVSAITLEYRVDEFEAWAP